MAKRLQVVLNKTVTKLGQLGDLVEVAPGYARNYLLPQGLATLATPGILKQVEFRKAKEAERLQALKEEALTLKAALEKVGRFVVRKQVGEAEAIFGTVTTQDVADNIKENASQEVDRRSITIPDIGKIGEYEAQIKLHPEVMAEVIIEVASL
jgi:large subunit ribosomal protein L9